MSRFVRLTLLPALMSATLLAAPLSNAIAAGADPAVQTAPPAGDPARSGGETIDQRIAKLHKALEITPDEETSWTGVATAMRDSAATMQKLAADNAAEPAQSQTAVDDLKTYERFAHAHVDGLANLTNAFEQLYAAMPDAQKKVADQVFRGFGPKTAQAHG